MTLSVLASLIILITLSITFGFVKGLDSFYILQSTISNKALKESNV